MTPVPNPTVAMGRTGPKSRPTPVVCNPVHTGQDPVPVRYNARQPGDLMPLATVRHPLWTAALVLAACTGSDPDDMDTNLVEITAFDQDNALGLGGHPLLPWPSDQYLAVDAQGTRAVAVDPALLPTGIPADLLDADGFSRLSPIVTWLPGSVDPASLPDADDWGASLQDDSPVRVVVLQDDAEPVAWPVMAETDATAGDPADATLILRPHRPLPFGSTVVVGLRTTLTDHSGAPHPPSQALARLLDGAPEGDAEASLMDRERDALLAALPLIGPSADDLAMAVTFTVRSEADVTGPTIGMQDAAAAESTVTFTIEDPTYEDDRALVYGTMQTPWFLDADNRVVLDEAGRPVEQERRDSPFLVTIPRTVTETRPTMLFGHGFFSAIEEPTWGNLFNGLARWEMPAVTTKFHGFAEADLATIAIPALGGEDIAGLKGVIDLQAQSQSHFTLLHTLIAEHLSDTLEIDWPDDDSGAFKPLSATELPYMGISNGGTQGLVMMTTSPVLSRGALVVPGGGWAHMLQRAAQWTTLGAVFSEKFTSDAELQLAMSMVQQVFDPVDSLNYVDHLVDDRLPGRVADPDLLLVEAVNDSQVANLVTRWIVGAAQVPVLTPSVADVWDAPSLPDDQTANVAFESYDLGVQDNPPGNVAPEENGVHNDVRLLDAYREQMGIFLQTGVVERTCEGPCDPE